MKRHLQVLCAGAAKAAFTQTAALFRERTGIEVRCSFGSVGALLRRLEAGEQADLLVLNSQAAEQLVHAGKACVPTVQLGTVGIGLAVQQDAPALEVPSPEALRQVLLDAPSLAYADPAHGDTSGIHFHGVVEKLGLAQQLAGKTRFAQLGLEVVEFVKRGEVALGATQASVIATAEGVRLAALLPAELQKWTTYVGVRTKKWVALESASLLLTHLEQPASVDIFRSAGFLVDP